MKKAFICWPFAADVAGIVMGIIIGDIAVDFIKCLGRRWFLWLVSD
jgi:hypothetical protein